MRWPEFADLVGGLAGDTALARVAQVRTETDPKVIAEMTPAQRRERAEWQRRRAAMRPARETEEFVRMMQEAFATMFGKEG